GPRAHAETAAPRGTVPEAAKADQASYLVSSAWSINCCTRRLRSWAAERSRSGTSRPRDVASPIARTICSGAVPSSAASRIVQTVQTASRALDPPGPCMVTQEQARETHRDRLRRAEVAVLRRRHVEQLRRPRCVTHFVYFTIVLGDATL